MALLPNPFAGFPNIYCPYEPLIASLAIDCGVKVNILGADTRNIDGKAFGTMLLGLPQDPTEAAKAVNYIQSQPNVTMEEVPDHG